MKLITLTIGLSLFIALFGESAKIKGQLLDKDSGEPIMMAAVKVMQNDLLIKGTITDFDGNYSISKIDSGVYNIEFSCISHKTKSYAQVELKTNSVKVLNADMIATKYSIDIIWTGPTLKSPLDIVRLPNISFQLEFNDYVEYNPRTGVTHIYRNTLDNFTPYPIERNPHLYRGF